MPYPGVGCGSGGGVEGLARYGRRRHGADAVAQTHQFALHVEDVRVLEQPGAKLQLRTDDAANLQ